MNKEFVSSLFLFAVTGMFVIEVCMYVASDNYESHEGSIRKSIIQRININKYIFLILHTLELCCYAIFTQRRVPTSHALCHCFATGCRSRHVDQPHPDVMDQCRIPDTQT